MTRIHAPMTCTITYFLIRRELKGVKHNVLVSALILYGWVKLSYSNHSSICISRTYFHWVPIISRVGSTTIDHKHFHQYFRIYPLSSMLLPQLSLVLTLLSILVFYSITPILHQSIEVTKIP